MNASSLTKQVEAVLESEFSSEEDKKKVLLELANLLLTANTESRKTVVELELQNEKKTAETQKRSWFADISDGAIYLTKSWEAEHHGF